jgi:hypothetical protein
MALMVGALACARNTEDADTDETAAARDTTVSDTLGGDAQNPPGYRGMERDTTMTPSAEQSDTFLQNQGTGQGQDTSGYSGMERVDTTGQANQQGQADTTSAWGTDTTGAQTGQDTTGMAGQDTTSMTGQTGTDSLPSGDTTGYDQSQQDTTSSQ